MSAEQDTMPPIPARSRYVAMGSSFATGPGGGRRVTWPDRGQDAVRLLIPQFLGAHSETGKATTIGEKQCPT